MITFKEYTEKAEDARDIIKAFRKKKIIVKMIDYDTLVGRMDSEEEAKEVMDNFNFIYKTRTGIKDKDLVYIELNGSMDESKVSNKKELKALNKMLEDPNFKNRPYMMKILQRVAELQEILNESLDDLVRRVKNFVIVLDKADVDFFEVWSKKNLRKEVYTMDIDKIPDYMSDKELKKVVKDLGIK